LNIADVGGDGNADLVSIHTDGNVYIWEGTDSGQFQDRTEDFSGTFDIANFDESGNYVVALGDVTGDGAADLVSAHTNGNALVWQSLRGSSGGFSEYVKPALSAFSGTLNISNLDEVGHFMVGVSDVTGDQEADLVSVNTNGNAYVWPANFKTPE